MVDIDPGVAIASGTASQRAPSRSLRRVLSLFFKQSAPGIPLAAGYVPVDGLGYTPLDVLPHATLMQYTVKAGYAVTTRSGEGGYIVGSPIDVVVGTVAANGTNPRWDVLYIVQPDYEKGETGNARIDIVNGSAAASPQVPAIPAGALELGRKLVPAAATNTTTGTAISNKPSALGFNLGPVPASAITDPQNLDVGKISGKRITVNNTGSAPSSPSVGDVWIDYS